MSKKLNSMPDYTAHMPKSAHDVSQSTAYTTCPGMLSPVYFDMLHVGDKLHFSASEFVRLNPLESQPLGQIDVHLDYFFVPLTVMYTPASSMFYQTDDFVSGVFDSPSFNDSSFPVFDFQGFLAQIRGEALDLLDVESHLTDSYSLRSDFFDVFGKSIYRIWDFLDMSPTAILDAAGGLTYNGKTIDVVYPNYTPWFVLAYQAIYQLYFRNDDREVKNYHYNIDKHFEEGGFGETDLYRIKSIFNMNYVSRPKDYFNSVKFSPMGSSVSMLESRLGDIYGNVNSWLNDKRVTLTDNDLATNVPLDGDTTGSIINTAIGGMSANSVRQLFMVDKLLRVIGRAEKNYESQFLAHFGIKIPHDAMHSITHIGHDMVTLTPDSVISTANTYNSELGVGSALGEIGGQGKVMLSGRKHSFEAPFHGVFMCISHIVPRRRYVVGLSKLHQLNSITDFYQPEFDKKGMQPLFSYEARFDIYHYDVTKRFGWQFGYEQFKRKYDRVTSAFTPTRSVYKVNTYAPWVIANTPFEYIDLDGQSSDIIFDSVPFPWQFLVSPNDLNVNMQVPHNTFWPEDAASSVSPNEHKPWLLYQTDPFICDFNMYCKKVNSMSEYGEPEL